MADGVRDHIHIWAVGDTFTGTDDHKYHVIMNGIKDAPTVLASHTRALNGSSHPHVLVDNGGAPVLIKDVTLKIWTTLAERAALAALQGRSCHYIKIVHMEDDEAHVADNVPLAPGYQVFMLPISDDAMVDPGGAYWIMAITLKDDSF